MEEKEASNDYFIWGIDDSPYGPVALSVLIDWISDERVLADTWVFARHDGNWRRIRRAKPRGGGRRWAPSPACSLRKNMTWTC